MSQAKPQTLLGALDFQINTKVISLPNNLPKNLTVPHPTNWQQPEKTPNHENYISLGTDSNPLTLHPNHSPEAHIYF